jgi:molybdenum-dependent DNA-binding transcriptional regulator ModE
MALTIQEFGIKALHGNKNLQIPIKDNRLVLVGLNGLGKTTVVSLLYYVLTRQWARLLDYNFEEISIKTGRKRFVLGRADIIPASLPNELRRRFEVNFPASIRIKLRRDPQIMYEMWRSRRDTEAIKKISRDFGIPFQYVMQALDRMERLFQPGLFDEVQPGEKTPFAELDAYLRENLSGEVLYLPTYRRIEQDLKAIFPHLEEEILSFAEDRKRRLRASKTGVVEFVQFGMEDVEEKIKRVLSELKESVRMQLNNLAGSYLRDVIRGQADTYEKSAISSLTDDDINKILDRVEEKTLSEEDKRSLKTVIGKLRSRSTDLEGVRDRYLAHYFSKLVEIYTQQQQKDSQVRKFVEVCNKYLTGKGIRYDDVNYSIDIVLDNEQPVAMRSLSSGEKQIVSLFSHVYLGEADQYYVLIDEPELSLSIEWQKALLPDILASKKCEFLVAVTHSPFIFDNDLDPYAIDLKECVVG